VKNGRIYFYIAQKKLLVTRFHRPCPCGGADQTGNRTSSVAKMSTLWPSTVAMQFAGDGTPCRLDRFKWPLLKFQVPANEAACFSASFFRSSLIRSTSPPLHQRHILSGHHLHAHMAWHGMACVFLQLEFSEEKLNPEGCPENTGCIASQTPGRARGCLCSQVTPLGCCSWFGRQFSWFISVCNLLSPKYRSPQNPPAACILCFCFKCFLLRAFPWFPWFHRVRSGVEIAFCWNPLELICDISELEMSFPG
jgi:hypothetical protein